jgi:hypothetical protein
VLAVPGAPPALAVVFLPAYSSQPAWAASSGAAGQPQEIVPVEGAAEAFAVEHRIVAQRLGHDAILGRVEVDDELLVGRSRGPPPIPSI